MTKVQRGTIDESNAFSSNKISEQALRVQQARKDFAHKDRAGTQLMRLREYEFVHESSNPADGAPWKGRMETWAEPPPSQWPEEAKSTARCRTRTCRTSATDPLNSPRSPHLCVSEFSDSAGAAAEENPETQTVTNTTMRVTLDKTLPSTKEWLSATGNSKTRGNVCTNRGDKRRQKKRSQRGAAAAAQRLSSVMDDMEELLQSTKSFRTRR